MSENYNTSPPTPNRFLVTQEQLNILNGLRAATIGDESNSKSSSGVGEINIDETIKLLAPYLNVDSDKLGVIIEEFAYIKSEIKQLSDQISMGVTQEGYVQAIGVGELDGLYTKLEKLSAELSILKDSINLAVSSTNYESLEQVINGSLIGLNQKINGNLSIIVEQLDFAQSEIKLLKEQIELQVVDVEVDRLYVPGSNDIKTNAWINSMGAYSAELINFEYTDATGWIGNGSEESPYALRFNGEQYLSISNDLSYQTPSTQSFTVEAFLKLKSATNQKLINFGDGIFLSDNIGFPKIIMNNSSSEISYSPQESLILNNLIHVVYRFDVQRRIIDITVNNNTITGITKWNGPVAIGMPSTLKIGEGLVADVYLFRLYKDILTSDEIAVNYNQGLFGVNFVRNDLVLSLDARKVESISGRMNKYEAGITVLKDSITTKVNETTTTKVEELKPIITPHVILFSNENQSITTNSNGITKSSITISSSIDTYKGIKRIQSTIGDLLLKDLAGNTISTTGVTLTKVNPTTDSSGSITMTINNGVNLSADSGYIEIPVTIESNIYYKKLTWNKAKDGLIGANGYTPVKGVDYFDGKDGQNGISSYVWVRYSQNSNGNPMTIDPTGAKYMGVATTTSQTAPSDYASYVWSLIKGTDGLPGEKGIDGQTSYLHIKYSNDGGSTFTSNNGEDVGSWIGTYVDFVLADSNNVTSYTWNKVKGEDGLPGEDAQLLYLSSTADAMTFDADGTPNPASQTITFTANLQNITGTATFTATPYIGTTVQTNITLGGSGNTRTLAQSQWGANVTSIKVVATLGSLSDTVTIVALKNGAKGSTGNAGQNAIVGYLTNESVTLGADKDGNVGSFASASGTFKVFDGVTDKTGASVTYSINSQTSGITASINTSGVYSVTAMTIDSGIVEFKAIYNGVTILKVLTLAKSKTGATGSAGASAKVADILPSSQIFKSTDGGVTFSPDTIVLTPALQNVTFSKWQYSIDGGTTWVDANGANGITIASNVLTFAKGSTLFTSTVTSIVFKLLTSDATVYDTITIIRLYDVTDIQIGVRNLLPGSDFENDTAGFVVYDPVNNAGTTLSLSSDYAYSGTKSLKFVKGSAGTGLCGISKSLPTNIVNTIKGQTITLSIKLKASGTGIGKKVYLDIYNNKSPDAIGKNIVLTSDWQTTYVTQTIPSDATSVYLYWLSNELRSGDVVYADCVKLELGNKATDWTAAHEDIQSQFDDMASDMKITPLEKQALSREWEAIKAAQTELSAQAVALNVTKTAYDTAYNNLNGVTPKIVVDILSDMTTTYAFSSTINRDAFKSKINTYFAEEEKLRKALNQAYIANLTIGMRNLAQGTATDKFGAYSVNTTISMIDGQYTQIVKATCKVLTLDTIFGLQQLDPYRTMMLQQNEKYTLSFEVRGNVPSLDYIYIMVIGGTSGNLSIGTTVPVLSDTTFNKVSIPFTYTKDGTSNYVMISRKNKATAAPYEWFEVQNIKVEKGDKATDWTPSIEDTQGLIDDINNALAERINSIETNFIQKSDVIGMYATVSVTNGLGKLIEENKGLIETTARDINLSISKIDENIRDANGNIIEIKDYMKFDTTGLTIGKSTSPMQVVISNSEMNFLDNGKVIAYINGQKMYIDSLEVLNNIVIGQHKLEKYDSNITLIRWVGGN